MKRFESVQIGDCTLYCGDCLDILPTLGKVDAVVTDPPYGIKRDKGFGGFGGFGKPIARTQYRGDWDSERPSKEYFEAIGEAAKTLIIFGGNFFADVLPVGNHWIVWDKLNTMPTFGDCELAWTNVKRNSVKKICIEYNGLLGKEKEKRQHPTQKPVDVMAWIVLNYTNKGDTVLDPFCGSGTTGVACKKLGRKFVGIEIDPHYFQVAQGRIAAAEREPGLPLAEPKPKQEAMEI